MKIKMGTFFLEHPVESYKYKKCFYYSLSLWQDIQCVTVVLHHPTSNGPVTRVTSNLCLLVHIAHCYAPTTQPFN